MTGRWDTVQVDGGPMQVFVNTPDGSGPHPGVVVIMGLGGVDQQLQRVVDRLAEAGYAAAAPDLYHRQDDDILSQPAPQGMADPVRRGKLYIKMGHLRDQDVEVDVQGTLGLLRGLPDVGSAPVGITGFCLGGRIAYLMAARVPELSAAALFYPHNLPVPWGDVPSPFEQTSQIGAPLIGFFGDNDGNPSPGDRMMVDALLNEHGKAHEFHSYPEVGHGFLTFDDDGSPRAVVSKDAWSRLLDFFGKHLKAPVARAH